LEALQKAKTLQTITGVQFDIEVFPNKDGIDDKAYLQILSTLKQPACSFVAIIEAAHKSLQNHSSWQHMDLAG
jgi:hypothetical protein